MFKGRSQYEDWRALSKAIDEADEIPGCTNYPDLWFPEGGGSAGTFVMEQCAKCPVMLQCREYGVRWEDHGVWGGVAVGRVKKYAA